MSRWLMAVFSALLLLPQAAKATEVTLPFNNLTLNAKLELAAGKSIKDGVVLMTHGTLAHNAMEIIASQQGMLKERGLSTLAINLSLGLDNRHGMYDCKVPHTHQHFDAMKEIGAWVNWLKGQGVKDITLFGHSRGGNQTAWYAADNDSIPEIKNVVLAAPPTFTLEKAADGYEARYKKQLFPLLGKMMGHMVQKTGDTVYKDVDILYCPKATVTAASFFSYYNKDPFLDTPTILKQRITKPVLVVVGSEDKVVAGIIEAMKTVKKPNVSLKVIDDAEHFFRDLYGEDLADAVAEFVGGSGG